MKKSFARRVADDIERHRLLAGSRAIARKGEKRGGKKPGKSKRLIFLNPGSKDYTKHRYVLWFDAHAPTYFVVWADSLQDAVDEVADEWMEKNAPGWFQDEQIEESFKEGIEEGLSEEDAQEQATADMSPVGGYGRYISSEDWGVEAEDPSREQILELEEHLKGRY